MTYRGIINSFKFSNIARAMLKLKRVPNYSTLIKFHKSLKTKDIDSLLCKKEVMTSAIDASGFETNHMSYHYANVWNSQDKRKYRRYLN